VRDPGELADLRRTAEALAVEAAALVRERAAGRVEVADRKSSAVDVVTEVDRDSEALLRRRVSERRPGDGFFGEEGGRSRGSRSGVTWVVDPIDGTVNFLYGIPHYAVSVAAVDEQERSLAGVVVHVATGAVYSAALGLGATRDGVPLRVRSPVPLAERLLHTGFQYTESVRRVQGQAVSRLVTRIRDVRRMGSAALDLCSVAEGTADGYVEEGPHLWDHAGAALVATEAGARFEVHAGAGGMDCLVCAPSPTFDELLAVVRDCGFLA
jgi:myo-inositol-1(or 4)-monophosphatase